MWVLSINRTKDNSDPLNWAASCIWYDLYGHSIRFSLNFRFVSLSCTIFCSSSCHSQYLTIRILFISELIIHVILEVNWPNPRQVTLIPPDPLSTNPTLTVSLQPNFTLELNTTSLMGSRAKLADVPKLHELIQAQVRRVLTERGTWKVVMPWLTTVKDVKEELEEKGELIDGNEF